MKKRILSILLSIIMLLGMIPLGAIPAFAGSFAYVEYIDEDGVLQSKFMDNVGVITSDTRVIGDGWYIVNKDVALPEDANLTVNGNANIILYDDCTLKITPYQISSPGIALSSGKTLNVFGQQFGSGTIEAYGGNQSAGIGGAYNGTCGTVNIYGGRVYAYGGSGGQGIGGGFYGGAGAVNVYGGYLYAQGGYTYKSINGTLNVFADQTKNKIMYVMENGINISGSPFKTKKENITITSLQAALEVETVGIDSKYINRYWDEETNCVVSEEKTIPSDAKPITSDTTTLSDGWYVVDKNVTLPNKKNLTVTGNAKIILCDGCTLKIPSPDGYCPGIDLSNGNSDAYSLTVYGQKNGSGRIEAYGNYNVAGIGGKKNTAGGTLNIYGGNIEAHGDNGAGIGGGESGAGGTVNVYGGNIKAYGGGNGAGIGGSIYGVNGGTLNIYDGNIEAHGGGNAAGIGGAYMCDGGTVNIYGGSIKAYGNGEGSGIGSGKSANGGTLNVYGGKIEAYGGDNGAGIGGGYYSSQKGALNIYDICSVYAEGGDGDKGINSAITIYPDGAESGAPEIHITGDGKEIVGSPFTEKTEISNPLNEGIVIIGSMETKWTSTSTLPTTDGYYVLENDVTLSRGWNAPANAEITLDLNGHTIKRDLSVHAQNGYVICASGKLTILDSSEDATGLITGGGNIGNGGGIVACADSVVTLNGITVSGNYADTGGGIIISEKATVELNDCNITNNVALGGAGIYNSGTLTVNGGCLNGNYSSNNSGGFYSDSGSAEFKDCEIKNNRSDNYGGAFFIDYSASVMLDGCTVSGNSAKNGGGAFEMERADCKLVLKDSSVTGNSVAVQNSGMSKGGGIHFHLGSVTLKGKMTVKDNTCAGAVNNILMRDNTVTFDASGLSGDSVVYVNDGVLSAISGITNTNINALVMENGNHIVLNNGKLSNHEPDYTGEYVDNGDGTHSNKCTGCEKISAETEAHIWEVNDFRTHKCTLCDVVCNHEDKTEDHICDMCEYQICDHNNTVISYNWADNHSSCIAIKHCNDCNNDIETETATKIKLIEDTHGANCQTMGKGHYEATFATLGTAKTEINGSDTWYGDHHYINFVCEYCLDEDWYGAYEKAKADIDRAAGENPTAIVEMLAEYAKDLIYYADYVAEMLEIRDEYVAAINKLTAEEHTHEYGEATYIWNEDLTKCTAIKTCECGNAVIETVDTVKNGNTVTAAFTTDGFTEQEKIVEEVEDEAEKALKEAKTAAKAAIDNTVKNEDNDIKNYGEAAKSDIDELTTITAVTEKLTAALREINAMKTQKAITAALLELDNAAKNAVAAKSKAIAQAAKPLIENAESADEANAVLSEALTKIAGEEKTLANAKTAAKAAVDSAAGSKQSEAMKKIVSEVKADIDGAKSTEEVENAKQAGLARIEAQKQAEKPTEPDEPTKPSDKCPKCGGTHPNNFWGQIVCFFNRIGNWFRNLFNW